MQELTEGRFSLRPVREADVEPIRQWRNAQLDILRQTEPISPEQQLAYFESTVWPDFAAERPRNILLTFFEDGRAVGYGGLVHIAWEHARAEVSFLLQPEIAREPALYHARLEVFLRLLRIVAFQYLGLHRMFTETYAFRIEHIAALERCGFIREGTMRDHVAIDGKFSDSVIHAYLNY